MNKAAWLLATTALLAGAPSAAAVTRPPDPPCDPMACPDPVGGAKECVATLALAKDEAGMPVVRGDCDLR